MKEVNEGRKEGRKEGWKGRNDGRKEGIDDVTMMA